MLRKLAFSGMVITIALGIAACVSNPSATPQPTAEAILKVQATYKVVFPFKEPETADERFVYERNDVLTYMNWVRTKNNVKLAMALSEAVVSGGIIPLVDLLIVGRDSTDLTPYIPLEDVRTFQMAHPSVSDETYVPAEPVFYQLDTLRRLILIKQTWIGEIVLPENTAPTPTPKPAPILTPNPTSTPTLATPIPTLTPSDQNFVSLSVDEMYEKLFHSNRTPLQQEELWGNYKGKQVEWTSTLREKYIRENVAAALFAPNVGVILNEKESQTLSLLDIGPGHL